MDTDYLLDMMKEQQNMYLSAYEQGYRKGWDDACRKALDILNKPKRKYAKPEKTDE